MSDQHTAGPWEISGDSIVTDERCIANIETDGGYEAPSEEREANASLITAAPDLLAALVDNFEAIETHFTNEAEKFPSDSQHVVKGLVQIRAAISKAKGAA